jgi:hypothetical protein
MLLLAPAVAMRFTDEVNWGAEDFAAAALLLGGAGLALELAVIGSRSAAYRLGAGVAVAGALLLVWLCLAVGLIGDEGDPANLMYVGVIAVGAAGAALARFEPGGMARAMLGTAIALGAAAGTALALGRQDAPGGSIVEIVVLNGIFAALFIGSAGLFQRAART